MTNGAIENAVAVRDEMAAKIARAEEQIKEWRAKMQRAIRFIDDWEEFSGQGVSLPAVPDPDVLEVREETAKFETKSKPKNPKKEEVAEYAIEIIREHGKPMTRDELFNALLEKGVEIHGKNPPVVLQTMLWRMQNRIVHLKGFGYWPSDEAYMAADYVEDLRPEVVEREDSATDQGDLPTE